MQLFSSTSVSFVKFSFFAVSSRDTRIRSGECIVIRVDLCPFRSALSLEYLNPLLLTI